MSIPRKEYLEEVIAVWHDCLRTGTPLHIEKSRRLILSWLCTVLEIHALGASPGRGLISAIAYETPFGSKQFVWRSFAVYDRLVQRRPDWKLPKAIHMGSIDGKQLDSVILPNGSIIEAVNSEGESFRGGGAGIVRVEELSQRKRAKAIWSQAVRVCEGLPGQVGGFPYSVNNASANAEWHSIKRPI